MVIGFSVWLLFAWTRQGDKFAMAMEGWRLGGTHLVEISVVEQDRAALACASDITLGDVRCGFRADGSPFPGDPGGLRATLSPFNTIKGQLLLGAELWAAPELQGPLPPGRFTVVCNFHVLTAFRPALRWSPNGKYDPLKESIAAGPLTDCVIPK